ncbi:MAG TPA: protein kinase [Methanoregula sp.]|nr:protein kinase [Methanoregula sp.]
MSGAEKTAVLFTALLVFLLAVAPVSAKVITYDTTGASGTIQDIINSAGSGDSIFLPSGTYYGNIVIERTMVFGGLDSANPPRIISDTSGAAGITLSADGITVNGVVIEGNASCGLLVQSSNNRVSSSMISGHETGLALKSASNNIFTDNVLSGNSVGIDIDQHSRSNTFFLNLFNNPVNIISRSAQNTFISSRQDYQFNGEKFSHSLGNYWVGAMPTDNNGDGVGDNPYTPLSSQEDIPVMSGVTDSAQLVSPPAAYTIIKSAVPIDSARFGNIIRSQGYLSDLIPNMPQDFVNTGYVPGQSEGSQPGTIPQGQQPPGPLGDFFARFWWLIPIALIISAICGILFERFRKRQTPVSIPSVDLPPESRHATLVKKPAGTGLPQGTDEHMYTVRLPAALEKKYSGAEYVAEGGVCRVFRAWDEKNNRRVAVKVPIRFDEATGSQFTKELNVWEGLHHKNIVEIYAANIFPQPYIEMEYVESSLEGEHFPFDEAKAVEIITGVAEGLRYAHEQGIVHRDIKPGNIMLAPDGTPKITDWGLSKAQGTKKSGLIGFSLEYAAPEQLAPNLYGAPGPWTDIFQIGVLFYEMLSGHVPFSGDGMGEVTNAILHDEPAPALKAGKKADAINAIIKKCLMKRPQDRYASVAEVLSDLHRLDLTK